MTADEIRQHALLMGQLLIKRDRARRMATSGPRLQRGSALKRAQRLSQRIEIMADELTAAAWGGIDGQPREVDIQYE